MNNTLIKYKEHFFTPKSEQAAGFAPYSKGYESLFVKTKIVTKIPKTAFEFNFTEKSVENLFNQLHETEELDTEINLLFNATGSIKELAYICTLRALLSLFLKLKGKDYTKIQFKFYAKATTPSLYLLNTLNAIGINFLAVKNPQIWKNIDPFVAQSPIDPLYGNKTLNTEIEVLFFNLKKKLAI